MGGLAGLGRGSCGPADQEERLPGRDGVRRRSSCGQASAAAAGEAFEVTGVEALSEAPVAWPDQGT